ncbi:hypothetical protein BS17DRAFT_559711 [Gyrodon lividus]|nr:hypothetical protein BS17DRAFT_559711 [Gyrodon lividus]
MHDGRNDEFHVITMISFLVACDLHAAAVTELVEMPSRTPSSSAHKPGYWRVSQQSVFPNRTIRFPNLPH